MHNFTRMHALTLRFFILVFMGLPVLSLATPAAGPELPDPVTAALAFPAGRSPDSQGRFEIVVYCQAHFAIESLELTIGHHEEIVFHEALPTFNGPMKAGETKIWRVKGVVRKNIEVQGFLLPPSVTLGVKYIYPDQAILQHIEHQDNENQDMKERFLRRLDELEGGRLKIMRILLVGKPDL